MTDGETAQQETFDMVCEKRISAKTTKDYTLQIRRLFKWLQNHHREEISSDDIDDGNGDESELDYWQRKLPNLTDQMLKDWMLEESIHQSGSKKGQLKCRSNNDKNRSAILWLYGKFDVQLPSTFHSKSKSLTKEG